MPTTIQKWGNSLGLRIPKGIADQLGLREGSRVDVEVRRDELVVKRPRRQRRKFTELVAQMNRTAEHHAVDFGPPVGKEIW